MTLKEWDLETRIKRLEGSDLESIVNKFNNKIDSITNKAIFSLDALKLEFKLNQITQKKQEITEPYVLYSRAGGWLAAQSNCNQGLYGQ